MQRQFYKILFSLIFFQCSIKESRNVSLSVVGNWCTGKIKIEGGYMRLGILATDSTLIFIGANSEITKYKISNDTLIFSSPLEKNCNLSREIAYRFKFLITKSTVDSLNLIQISCDGNEYCPSYLKINQKLKFHRLPLQSDIVLNQISFSSSGCYGPCASLFLEINKNRQVTYFGKSFSCPKGGHVCKISNSDFKFIQSLINCIDLANLKDSYLANWTDDQTISILIETNKGKFRTRVYGYDKEPFEVRLLLSYLLNLPGILNLNPKKMDPLDITYQEIQKKLVPMDYPPDIEE